MSGSHRIGTAGWTMPAKPDQPGSHLFHYSRILNGVEINSTFYRPHQPSTWARWAAETPPDFRFSVKAPRAITHEAKLNQPQEALQVLLEQISIISIKTGPLLFQLPPSLRFDPSVAGSFLETLRKQFSGEVAFEPRHASWFDSEPNRLLSDFQVARVAADPPAGAPAAAEPGGSPGLAYYRLHGTPRTYYSAYDDSFLEKLAARICGHPNCWVIFDNTAGGHAYPNALRLSDLMASKRDIPSNPR